MTINLLIFRVFILFFKNSINFICYLTIVFNYLENKDIQITEAYNGIKNKDCRKWFYLLEFLKLTNNMSNSGIGVILGKNSENIRKQMDGFKKVEYYLSHFQKCNKNYHSLNLQFIYFQKILIADWNDVLINLNRMVQYNMNNVH